MSLAESSDAREEEAVARGQTAFSDLFNDLGTKEVIAAGTLVIKQGEVGRHGYLLTEGRVGIFAMTPFGEVQIATLSAPALVGEIAALAGLSRTASVKALESITILKLPGQLMLEAALGNPVLFLPVIRKLGRELETLNRAIGIYTDALTALEQQTMTDDILSALRNPPLQMAGFAQVFGRFAKEILAKRKHQEELASAAMIQQSFLPGAPELNSLSSMIDIHAYMSAARQVGGDFYDIINLDNHKVLVALGDVCGKGMPASLFMAFAITTLRSVARSGRNVGEIAADVNSLICKANTQSMFATAIIAVIDAKSGQVDFCNCGHSPLLHINTNGTISRHEKTGLPLGLFSDRNAAMKTIWMKPDEKLFLYSDGITEALNSELEEFGDQRLEVELNRSHKLRPREICDNVLRCTAAFMSDAEQSDDITCVAVQLP